MQWDSSASAGFTAGSVQPWLPLGDSATRNVADQRADQSSTLWFCHRLLALRRAELGGRIGRYRQLVSPPDQWIYRVEWLTVAANFSAQPAAPFEPAGPVLLSTGGDVHTEPGGVVLGPWQGVIIGRPAADAVSPAAAGIENDPDP